MTGPRITLLGSQEESLRTYLESHAARHERAAIVLFRRFTCGESSLSASDRFVAVDVIPFDERWISESSSSHIRFEIRHLRSFFQRCEEESLVFGFAHNHPGGPLSFSPVDEINEQTLLTALSNRNGRDIHFVALLISGGRWIARVRHGLKPEEFNTARHVLVIGQTLIVNRQGAAAANEVFKRQSAAFGKPFVDELSSLRVAVVGAGGTGSPAITLLARAGIKELVIVDNDKLESSNLNRVRGAKLEDVGRNKAAILRDVVADIGLSTEIAHFPSRVDEDPAVIDVLSTCDAVFGCTDDQIGRETLNAAVYLYALALIDVGLGGQVALDQIGQPSLRYHFGRVSTVLPEFGECLFCQGVINEQWIRHEYAVRENPLLTPAQAAERYLQGGGEHAPGVGPFTSAIADFSVATLFDLLQRFPQFPPELRRDAFRLDFVRMEFRSVQEKNDPDCPYCRRKEFLLRQRSHRLNRPALGRARISL